MITHIFMSSLLYLMIINLLSSPNPVKMSMILIVISSLMFLIMTEILGNSWFSMLFFLIFMGGILMMFMILSSLMPNEKFNKVKISIIMILLALSPLMMQTSNSSTQSQMKWFMQSNFLIKFIMLLIMIYFLNFMNIISKEKIPLHSSCCLM